MLHTAFEIFLEDATASWCLFDFRSFFWAFLGTFFEDGEAKDIFGGVDKSERRVLFIVHKLKFEGFSFEIDDPTHFGFLL